MNKEWITLAKEIRRTFSASTWVPLMASVTDQQGDAKTVGFKSEYFGCGSVAFPSEHRAFAEELGWSEIGSGRNIRPYAYDDGYYSPIEQYQYNDKEPIGVDLVFDYPQPVVGGSLWMLNPDLIVALGLIKDGQNWIRPEEDFVVVARETFDEKGDHRQIEIKREFLMDYLAARNLSLRISYYRQRVENVSFIEGSAYDGLSDHVEDRDGGHFELRFRKLQDVFGGGWASMRVWRTDIDEDDDAPVMGEGSNDNTEYESTRGHHSGYKGIRVEGEFWRSEWIDHQNQSVRVRGDESKNLPLFIVETDGTRMPSANLKSEDIGRWLWFRSGIVNELLNHRGFALKWYTAETGGIVSTSGYATHFGINASDLITVYAYDIARLESWEQHIWAAYNVVPEGRVSSELLASQVKARPASTYAVEEKLFGTIRLLGDHFKSIIDINLYNHEIDDTEAMQRVSRFMSVDQSSLLTLAKELVRVFSDRLNVGDLRKISTHPEKSKLASNKLLESILAQKVGALKAREVFGPIAGVYDMRLGDAHPTGSKVKEGIKLAGIDESASPLKQGEQLISNFGRSIWEIGRLLFADSE